jgi:pyroglutamyl-peptidase
MPDHRPILLTGFEPFAGDAVNPSWEAAQALDGWVCGNRPVVALRLPVVFSEARARLTEALTDLEPALVVCLGLAAGLPHLALERVAVNLKDARIPDNAGQKPEDEAVLPGAPAAYFTDLPVKAMLAALHEAGIPAALSLSAGTFVCNEVFFALRHDLATRRLACRGGFIHVPLLPAEASLQKAMPSMALPTLLAGLRIALEAASRNVNN